MQTFLYWKADADFAQDIFSVVSFFFFGNAQFKEPKQFLVYCNLLSSIAELKN